MLSITLSDLSFNMRIISKMAFAYSRISWLNWKYAVTTSLAVLSAVRQYRVLNGEMKPINYGLTVTYAKVAHPTGISHSKNKYISCCSYSALCFLVYQRSNRSRANVKSVVKRMEIITEYHRHDALFFLSSFVLNSLFICLTLPKKRKLQIFVPNLQSDTTPTQSLEGGVIGIVTKIIMGKRCE